MNQVQYTYTDITQLILLLIECQQSTLENWPWTYFESILQTYSYSSHLLKIRFTQCYTFLCLIVVEKLVVLYKLSFKLAIIFFSSDLELGLFFKKNPFELCTSVERLNNKPHWLVELIHIAWIASFNSVWDCKCMKAVSI